MDSTACLYKKKSLYLYIYKYQAKITLFSVTGYKIYWIYTGYKISLKLYRCQTEFVLMLNIQAIKVCQGKSISHNLPFLASTSLFVTPSKLPLESLKAKGK